MNVHLFGNYAGVYQPSMRYYGRALKVALQRTLGSEGQVRLIEPGSDPKPSRWSGYWTRYVKYPLEASRQAAEINHILDHGYSYLIYTLPAERTVITCHDLVVQRQQAGLLPGMEPFGWTSHIFTRQMRGLRRAAHIIAVSEQTRDDIVRFLQLPQEKITVIHSGVDPAFAPLSVEAIAQERKARGWSSADRVVLHVGGSFLYKNIPGLLRAIAKLRQEGLPVKLVKVGAPFRPKETALLRELDLEEVVQALGPVSTSELQRLYNAADVLAFPSWWEGFGWPPLEAMACGTVVAASDRGALREILQDAACIIPPDHPEEMAAGLRRALTDETLRRTLRQRGLARARQFTWEKTARATCAVYNRVREDALQRKAAA